MPSEHSPSDSSERERFPSLAEDISEDPARFLDRDLFEHGQVRLEERENPAYTESGQRVVRDGEVSAPGELIRDRINGIDDVAVAHAWVAIERRLERTPDGGRDVVIDFLENRIGELEADGERDLPGLDAEELRELGVDTYESVAPNGEVVILGIDGEPTSRSQGETADQKLAALADGGEDDG